MAGLPVSSTANRDPFPKTPEEFDADPRVSFSRIDNKYVLEDHDGTEWEYNDQVSKWVPTLDESLVSQQQAAYAVPGVDEDVDTREDIKQRKKREREELQNEKKAKRAKTNEKPVNRAVYVTSLPLDATIDEIKSVFSKCGMIAEELDSGEPRIKLYTDDNGKPKGDALIVYFRAESVKLAIQMLDDSDFRFGEKGPWGNMRVKEADFSYKKTKEQPEQRVGKDKVKMQKKMEKMNSKLTDWSDDESPLVVKKNPKFDKVVILKHMFTLEELEEDPAAILDIKEDIRDECSKLGEVTNVILYDKEKDGVASVRFTTYEAADACVKMMNGRMFGGQAVEAYTSREGEKFAKSGKGSALEDDEEEKKRLDKFGNWLEGKDGDENGEEAD